MILSHRYLPTINACSTSILGAVTATRSKNIGNVLNQVRYQSSKVVFREGDVVLLQQDGARTIPILSKPLQPDEKIKLHKDFVPTNHIIGKSARDIVSSILRKTRLRLHQPTLAQYCHLTPRIVTPIYAQDANLIVSLLDLHPSSPPNDEYSATEPDKQPQVNNETSTEEVLENSDVSVTAESSETSIEDVDSAKDAPLEIFEAGTGHGSLTLHLARAINGATPRPPKSPSQYAKFLEKRRAIVHTLDISYTHSVRARNVVGNFRRGMYKHCVDFHVGTIPNYLNTRLEDSKGAPMFAHAILDLPGTHKYLEVVGKSLQPDGTLITFNPSLTQIMDCLKDVKEKRLPFVLERVLEIGSAAGVGGREWDIRMVQQRATQNKKTSVKHLALSSDRSERDEAAISPTNDSGTQDSSPAEGDAAPIVDAVDGSVVDLSSVAEAERFDEAEAESDATDDVSATDEGPVMICRPKVGIRTEGGGFVSVWKRKAYDEVALV